MSISPAQFAIIMATVDPLARALAGGATPDREPAAQPAPFTPTQSSGPTLSISLRIDDQRRIYYEVINNRTGDEVLEIPPEQIRKLAEGLDESPVSQSTSHNVNVKA